MEQRCGACRRRTNTRRRRTARYFHTTVALIHGSGGTVIGVAGVTRDITARIRAEEELRRSEARYRLLAENATDMISRHDPDGVFLYASPACRALLGYEPEELRGVRLTELCHPRDVARLTRARDALLSAAESGGMTFRLRRKDGEYVWVETMARLVRDEESGAEPEFLAITRDITARRQAEANARRLIRARGAGGGVRRRQAVGVPCGPALLSLDMETTLRSLGSLPRLADWAVVCGGWRGRGAAVGTAQGSRGPGAAGRRWQRAQSATRCCGCWRPARRVRGGREVPQAAASDAEHAETCGRWAAVRSWPSALRGSRTWGSRRSTGAGAEPFDPGTARVGSRRYPWRWSTPGCTWASAIGKRISGVML